MKKRILLINDWSRHVGGAATFFNTAEKLLREAGFETLLISKENASSLEKRLLYLEYLSLREIYSPISNRIVKRYLREFKPDVVYVGNTHDFFGPSIFKLLKKHPCKIVWQINDYFAFCQNRYFYREDIKSICTKCHSGNPIFGIRHNCSGILPWSIIRALGNYIHRRVLKSYLAIDRILVTSDASKHVFENSQLSGKISKNINPLDWSKFPTPQFSKKKPRYAIFMGSHLGVKGLHRLLDSFPFLNKNVLIHFALGKSTPICRNIISARAERYGVSISILPESVNQTTQLYAYVCGALCSIIPSEWLIPSEYLVYESLALGTLPVISDLGGNQELFSEKLHPWIYKSGNAEDLAGKINAIFEYQDSDIEALSKYCHDLAFRKFSPQSWVESFTDAIE